eukprot:TRINITY_DN128_c0_g1_i1.p1 TRINITY_DN128_c0_g1~~TRINITY_DN128_c0_g1_i1.p1  ORF type:complete len:172 (-),score=37.51 TRINITY_DN128_c0_g1_i1:206-721(-)
MCIRDRYQRRVRGQPIAISISKMSRRGTTVKDVPADIFIKKFADFLKRQPKFQVPKWADLVKTGHFKELAPYDEDWFYIRAASVARKIYLRPGCGIGALRNWYGGAHRRGTRTTRHATASGAVIRNALKQLAAQGFVEEHPDGGRQVTGRGRAELDRIAGGITLENVEGLC